MVYLDSIFWLLYMLYKKLGVTRIIQFSQRNGKLSLPRIKQGYYPVIPIYATHNPFYVEIGLNPQTVLLFILVNKLMEEIRKPYKYLSLCPGQDSNTQPPNDTIIYLTTLLSPISIHFLYQLNIWQYDWPRI